MILDGNELKILPFSDSRGDSGSSGKLYVAETKDRQRYLVKSMPIDVANEYVAHNLAKLISVPTSDAVLIRNGNSTHVGITYKSDFQRVAWNDFLGTEQYSNSVPIYIQKSFHYSM